MISKKILIAFTAGVFFAGSLFAAPPSVFGSRSAPSAPEGHTISLGGNAYIVKGKEGARIHDERGLVRWASEESVAVVFFRAENAQKNVELSIRARGHGTIRLSLNREKKYTFTVKIDSDEFKDYPVGKVDFSESGYQKVLIKGAEKSGEFFGEISDIKLKGISGPLNYVRDFENYWERRGPSVHMRYTFPPEKNIEYFYNEVVVPEGMDKLSTYFMANGFNEGYCGIQVNSPTERRVLFSVWSPFDTQNPKDIPEHLRVVNLRRGKGVHIGEFGNEGSGGQSFLRYPWKAGETYGFLTRVRPDGTGNTEYTAYFHIPKERKWLLIASFRRPATSTWYKGAYSFLENFSPDMGYTGRKVFFSNQWAWDKNGKAYELTEGVFTCDSTANAGVRTDYAGGLSEDGKSFFLKNCGFFDGKVESHTNFERKSTKFDPPLINFQALEKL